MAIITETQLSNINKVTFNAYTFLNEDDIIPFIIVLQIFSSIFLMLNTTETFQELDKVIQTFTN